MLKQASICLRIYVSFPLLGLKGIDHYRKHTFIFFQGANKQMEARYDYNECDGLVELHETW